MEIIRPESSLTGTSPPLHPHHRILLTAVLAPRPVDLANRRTSSVKSRNARMSVSMSKLDIEAMPGSNSWGGEGEADSRVGILAPKNNFSPTSPSHNIRHPPAAFDKRQSLRQ